MTQGRAKRTLLTALAAACFGLVGTIPGCDNDSDLEDAAEETGDAMEDAADEVDDALDDVADDLDDAVDDDQ